MADEGRKTHIERVYGKGDNSDVWIDLEILDQQVTFREGGQKTVRQFAGDNTLMGGRDSAIKRVENPDDKTQYVEVKVWDKYKAESLANIVRTFANKDGQTTRDIEVRKVFSRDIDDRFLDAKKQPPREPKSYLDAIKSTNRTDETQYINVEVISKWNERGTGIPIYTTSSVVLQGRGFDIALKNSNLISDNLSDKRDRPVRLDPLQWIVNVSWGGGLAVDFGDKAEDSKYTSARS